MSSIEETLKYLSAMRVIDFNKLGFVYGDEEITNALNLIQKQQEEIKQLKIAYKLMENEAMRDGKAELEKKDEMIDEMAEKIFQEGIVWENKEEVKQYFEKRVEGE